MKIAIDFDGTCVTHDYPRIGKDIGAIAVLKKLVDAGHLLILFTMRSDDTLQEAATWFSIHDIPLYGVNRDPYQCKWTNSPKAYASLYIDDAALGCPLKNTELSDRPYVDWVIVEQWLILRGIL